MMICVHKKTLILFAFFFLFVVGMTAVLWYGHGPSATVFAAGINTNATVVIDPGHGGEDGGAVSLDGGVEEGQINLEVALRVNDLLRFAGQNTLMTRSENVSICDEGLSTVRQRKVSDLKNRAAIVNERENALLLSIHQNSLPSSVVTHGAQVFWNQQDGADRLGRLIQAALNDTINRGNEKKPKPIPGTIYLMRSIASPGVIVECGFLSNAQETAQLQEPSHQIRLAAAIAAGCLRYLAGEEIS